MTKDERCSQNMSLLVITTTLVPLFDLPYLFLYIFIELENVKAYVEYTPILLRLSHGFNFFIYLFYNHIFRKNFYILFEKSKKGKLGESNKNIFTIYT